MENAGNASILLHFDQRFCSVAEPNAAAVVSILFEGRTAICGKGSMDFGRVW